MSLLELQLFVLYVYMIWSPLQRRFRQCTIILSRNKSTYPSPIATHLTHYKVLNGGHFIQNELPTFRILLFRVRNVTKEDNRRGMSGSFDNQCERRMPKMWYCPKDSEKRMEESTATTATV